MNQENSRPFREDEAAAIDTPRISAQPNAGLDSTRLLEAARAYLRTGESA